MKAGPLPVMFSTLNQLLAWPRAALLRKLARSFENSRRRQKERGHSQVFPKLLYPLATHLFVPSLPSPHPPHLHPLSWALLDVHLNWFSPSTNVMGRESSQSSGQHPLGQGGPMQTQEAFLLLWESCCAVPSPASLVWL